MKLRYTHEDLDALKHQPVTIFTSGNHVKRSKNNEKTEKDDSIFSDGKVASRLFMEVASAVLRSGLNGKLQLSKVESLILECGVQLLNKERRVPVELYEIKKLYEEGQDNIQILYNKKLNSILTRVVDILAPYLSKANDDICKDIQTKFAVLNKPSHGL